MQKELMIIQRAINQIQEVIDSVVHGVTVGDVCPTCGREKGDNVLVNLEIPKSCDNCFVLAVCNIHNNGSLYCVMMWEKIISHYTKNIVHDGGK